MFLTFPCFALVVLHFLHVFVFLSLVFFVLLVVFLHSPHFSLFFIGVPSFSIGSSCMFVTFSYLFMDSPCSPIICHLSSFIVISCSLFMLSLAFLRPNLAVAVAAAIASVALLVAVVIVVVDLWHDGFKNKEREGGWGGGRSASPQGVLEGLDVASLCLVVVP